jgi:phosphohistidine phosphatase
MRLYLVRHGEALSEQQDRRRPLSKEGRKQAAKIADFLVRVGVEPERICHSGKLRAQQTAEIVASRLKRTDGLEAKSGISPNDPIESFLAEIAEWTKDALVVGHQPFLGLFTSSLLAGDSSKYLVDFRLCGSACLEQADHSSWVINWLVAPEFLGS